MASRLFSVRLRKFAGTWTRALTAETTVALLALLLTVFSAAATHKHDRLSVLPKLSFYWNTGSDQVIGLFVENSGAGPAIIKDFRIPDEEKLKTAVGNGTLSTLPEGERFLRTYFLPNNGQRVGLITISKDNVKDYNAFQQLIQEEVTVFIDYCSIYGDCWTECSKIKDPTCGQKSPAEEVFNAGFWSRLL